MNVLYIEDSGEILGGGQISLLTLLEGLDRSKFTPIVFCPSEGNFVDRLRERNFETYVFPPTLRSVFRWSKFISERQIELIHCNAGTSKPTFYGAIAAKLASIPFLWHVRVLDDGGWRDRILANLSTEIIAISKAVAEKFDWLDLEKVSVIWNGVKLDRFDLSISGDGVRDEFGIPSNCPLIGTIGRISRNKGLEYFIDACKSINDQIKNVQFLIVGQESSDEPGYKTQLVSQIQKLGLSEKFIFTGFRDDIPELISALDLFVLSSVSEGFGRVVIETMAMAKPVVATNVGGVPDIVVDEETGILVPVKDPDAIATAVLDLLSNRSKVEYMGKAGRIRVERLFTLEVHVEKIQKLYRRICSTDKAVR